MRNPDRFSRGGGNSPLVTILNAEDSLADANLLQEALAQHGVHANIFLAEDGSEAIKILNRIEAFEIPCPDLLVLDLNLPKMDGFAVLRHARSIPQCSQKPIVILSSSDAASERARAFKLGASCYIKKPMDLEEYMSIGATLKAMLENPLREFEYSP